MNNTSTKNVNVSRREFLQRTAAGSLIVMGKASDVMSMDVVDSKRANVDLFEPDFFVSIDPSGDVSILAHRSEMGTGIRTTLPRIVADELEADWNRVTVVQAIGDKKLGDQNTDGSNSVRAFFERMRVAGATARTMLEQAAAKKWDVDMSTCHADSHQVVHAGSGRTIGFGELVNIAQTLEVPKPDSLTFKPKDKWKYIGKDAPITDMNDILTGKAVYGIDARMDNQLYAVVARPAVLGRRVKSFDAEAARQVPGVVDIIEIPTYEGAPVFKAVGGVAVCATSTWAAIEGRDLLEIDWEKSQHEAYDTDTFAKTLADSANKPGEAYRNHGDAMKVINESKNLYSADYSAPHLAHATMETPAAVADVKTEGGKVIRCTVSACTQNPQAVQQAVGEAMGMNKEDVVCNVTLLGSGFGRKSKPDYCVEAATLSRKLGRPVHVTWTREDDMQNDYFHTMTHVRVEAAIDDRGMPTAWLQRAAYPTINSTFELNADLPMKLEAEMGLTDLPYDVPNLRVEVCRAKAHTRIGWYRSVCHIPQNFAVSSFADELAHRAGLDPYEFLIELLGDDRHVDLESAGLANRGVKEEDFPYDIGRLKAVTKRVAEAADWSRGKNLPKGRGLGIACYRGFLGYSAHVVEVDIAQDGTLTIPKVWVCMDSGLIVNPDRVRAQVEGSAIMATTHAMYGKVTFKNGASVESNYDSYRMATMADSPKEIFVDLVDSDAAPAGVGETSVPTFTPALCNAIFAAIGKRIRDLPIFNHDLSWN